MYMTSGSTWEVKMWYVHVQLRIVRVSYFFKSELIWKQKPETVSFKVICCLHCVIIGERKYFTISQFFRKQELVWLWISDSYTCEYSENFQNNYFCDRVLSILTVVRYLVQRPKLRFWTERPHIWKVIIGKVLKNYEIKWQYFKSYGPLETNLDFSGIYHCYIPKILKYGELRP